MGDSAKASSSSCSTSFLRSKEALRLSLRMGSSAARIFGIKGGAACDCPKRLPRGEGSGVGRVLAVSVLLLTLPPTERRLEVQLPMRSSLCLSSSARVDARLEAAEPCPSGEESAAGTIAVLSGSAYKSRNVPSEDADVSPPSLSEVSVKGDNGGLKPEGFGQ